MFTLQTFAHSHKHVGILRNMLVGVIRLTALPFAKQVWD